ncbi:MAG: protein-methionine-sulfoxide reductase heme-binding subunit MsrQ [Pseudomonadota bacterium]|nr:protein-methionine-sulfoxide reductase heme-binding subunit MsrQ [Pseudomonadota bacterium]
MYSLTSKQIRFVIKPIFFLGCALPFFWLLLAIFNLLGQRLGPEPITEIQDHLGIWGLRFLLVTLSLTPLSKLTGQFWWLKLRRMSGLFSLFYISCHFLNYISLDQGFAWKYIWEDILERPFISIGMIALLLMIPLGITSTKSWMRRLGKKWYSLHRLVYLIAMLSCWHLWWQVKLDTLEPLVYVVILTTLFGVRWYYRSR